MVMLAVLQWELMKMSICGVGGRFSGSGRILALSFPLCSPHVETEIAVGPLPSPSITIDDAPSCCFPSHGNV